MQLWAVLMHGPLGNQVHILLAALSHALLHLVLQRLQGKATFVKQGHNHTSQPTQGFVEKRLSQGGVAGRITSPLPSVVCGLYAQTTLRTTND